MKWSTRAELLAYLHGDHPMVPVCVPKERTGDLGRKLWLPSPLRHGELGAVVEQHLAGQLAARVVRSERKGREWLEDRATTIGAYVLRRDRRGQDWARWICFDIDGPDHALQETPEAAWQRTLRILGTLAQAELRPVLERSHGGAGWHVWSIWPTWAPAAFAYWLARRVAEYVGAPNGTIECFPKQAALDKLGNLVALPWPGAPAGEGGGEVLHPDLSPRPVEDLRAVERDVLQRWVDKWQAAEHAAATRRQVLPPERRARRRSKGGKREEVDVMAISLEDVARAFGTITAEQGGELLLDCPRHTSRSKRSLMVDPGKGEWVCFGCKAAGDEGALTGGRNAYSLARFLLPDLRPSEIYDELRELERKRV